MTDNAQHVSAQPRSGLDEHSCEVMDAAPVMIWVSGVDKLCTWFNKPWLDFTGRSLQQELGNGWAEGVHPIDLQHCLDIYIKQFDAREPFRMQYRLRRHDGNYRWIDDVGVPRRARDGTFLGYWGSCTDVHEAAARLEGEIAVRSRAERDAKSSSQLGVLIDSIQDYAIYMIDQQGRVMSWNRGAARIKGYSAEEIVGQDFAVFYTEADRQKGLPMRALGRALAEGRYQTEGWQRRKDGTEFWATTVLNPIYDNAGTHIGFATVTQDVSEKSQTYLLD